MHLEIDSLDDFDTWAATPAETPQRCLRPGAMAGVSIQSLDLTSRSETLRKVPVRGVLFLGCALTEPDADSLLARGALVFPQLPDLPFNAYQNGLHTAADLYRGLEDGYPHTPDAQVYAWFQSPAAQSLPGGLAQALHDHGISESLDDLFADADPGASVGIMGGHAAQRGGQTYRDAARAGALLAGNDRVVLTGGGPGAMEAANLGARLTPIGSSVDEQTLTEAIDLLAQVPTFHDPEHNGAGITRWARSAFEVLERWPHGGRSLGIPTWFYGHEPPNVFASHIAKYFSNAIREDILLQRCRGGVVYLPGAAGTVQEVFQFATGNYYLPPGAEPMPMVLVGREHWTTTLPAFPLLQALGRGRPMGEHVHLVDSVDEALDVVLG
ncbi:LOG family protein [Propionibacteriaceae bacterium G1746]